MRPWSASRSRSARWELSGPAAMWAFTSGAWAPAPWWPPYFPAWTRGSTRLASGPTTTARSWPWRYPVDELRLAPILTSGERRRTRGIGDRQFFDARGSNHRRHHDGPAHGSAPADRDRLLPVG